MSTASNLWASRCCVVLYYCMGKKSKCSDLGRGGEVGKECGEGRSTLGIIG